AALGHAEADGFLPDHPGYRNALERYVEQLQRLKTALAVPVIASLNGVSRSGWLHHAQALEAAGADALELNVYYLAASPAESGTEVELKSHVRIPFAVKLSPQFSALPHFVRRIEGEGAGGLVLFNRFYQPDIDIDTLSLVHRPTLSHPGDALLALHWIALLRGRTTISLAAGGGVKSA
ncbi:MAG: dihydroorotate dehydrogenase-like protein, partial [Anaerolineae bacterium]|nr:dihydroorotate dehydrogenase-like protein [Anaerolineae bacterium]